MPILLDFLSGAERVPSACRKLPCDEACSAWLKPALCKRSRESNGRPAMRLLAGRCQPKKRPVLRWAICLGCIERASSPAERFAPRLRCCCEDGVRHGMMNTARLHKRIRNEQHAVKGEISHGQAGTHRTYRRGARFFVPSCPKPSQHTRQIVRLGRYVSGAQAHGRQV